MSLPAAKSLDTDTARVCRGILLAAGSSSRFGADKLLHPLPEGMPIAVASARHLVAALPGSLAVVRPDSAQLAERLREAGCEVTVCPDARDGMGVSLAHAIGVSVEGGGAQSWIVALADMPYISPDTIRKLAASLEGGALIAAPAMRGRRGHPVGFASALRGELLALRGDQGARGILKRHRGDVQLVEVDDPGIWQDIDTPQDVR